MPPAESKVAESKVTQQGQISVPAEVRKRLGIAPGSTLEWIEDGEGKLSVRRAQRYSSQAIHEALFEDKPTPKTVEDMDASIKRAKRARR